MNSHGKFNFDFDYNYSVKGEFVSKSRVEGEIVYSNGDDCPDLKYTAKLE